MIFRILLLSCLLFPGAVISLRAQTSSIKSPGEFLTYPLGSRFTPHHLLVDYFQYVDGVSDKVQLIQYGQTYELRPLIAAIISSPANMKRIENIRQNNLRRTGMLAGDVQEEDIAFVYLSYSVHGNEAAGSESSMAVLYDLINGSGPYTGWLENAVVIIDPCLNPDGYNRYSQWSNAVSTLPYNPNPDSREHNEPWPGGRFNHYYYDLNRDWAWQTQQESRDRIAFYLQWMPHIHADIHEMNAETPYYFAPAAQPYHPYVTPFQSSFQVEIGKNHAIHFDNEGWRYFTKERFDLFYPSYGDTYPAFAGAIGMTYEQGGGGYANRAVQLDNGDTLTLLDRIDHHRVSSLSTIEVGSKNASRLVDEFQLYFKNTKDDPPGPVNSYVIKYSNNPGRISELLLLLKQQGIQFGVVENHGKHYSGFSYQEGKETAFTTEENDIVIPASQPRSVLLQVLFEPEGLLSDSLTYDITAWSVPMAFGLDAYSTEAILDYNPWSDIPPIALAAEAKPYAYAFQWGSIPAVQTLASLLQKGIVARFANETFNVGNTEYPSGTILLMRADNRKNSKFDQAVKSVASVSAVPFSMLKTGFVESGKDLGSDVFTLVRKPEVLTFAGDHMSALNHGEVWHFFEQELKYPVHIVDIEDKDHINLHDYNVILLTEGYYELEDSWLTKVNEWVSQGGRLVVIGSGLNHVAGKSGFGLKYKSNSESDSVLREESAHYPDVYSSGERKSLSEDIPGAVFQTTMDHSHPLTFGLGDVYWTLKTSSSSFAWLKQNGNAIYLDDTHHHYGFAGYKALEKMKSTLVAGQQHKDEGSIVYLVDNPLFRSFWNSGKVLFSNAVFF